MRDAEFVRFIRDATLTGPRQASETLGVSERTIRSYVRRANCSLNGFARIVLSRRSGYTLEVADEQRLEKWLGTELSRSECIPQTPGERVAYLLNDLLMRTDWITMDALCAVLYISRSTLTSDLKVVEAKLSKFDLSLLKRPHHGIRIEGAERARRVCLANVAVESMGDSDLVEGALLERISRCVENAAHEERFQIIPTAYQSLLVHISIALMRIQEGCYVPMEPEHLEQLRLAREYAVAEKIARGVERDIDVVLPQEEIAYIAIRLAGRETLFDAAEDSEGIIISDEVWVIVSAMLECVWRSFRFDFRSDLELRMNLARHLVPLTVRLRYRMRLENPMLADIKVRFALAYSMAADAVTVLADTYSCQPSEDEIGYLALAFALALERQKYEAPRKSILMVCASGAGSARLLEYRCRREFGDYIETITTCDVLNLDTIDFSNIDYVFTTVPIERPLPVPVREVTCFLDRDDVTGVRDMLRGDLGLASLPPFFRRRLFYPHLPATTKREALDLLLDRVCSQQQVSPDFRELVWKREGVLSTAFGNRVALPHPLEPRSAVTVICVGLLDQPVIWDEVGREVQAIFLLAFAAETGESFKSFLAVFTDILMSKRDIDLLISQQTWETLADIVMGAFASSRAAPYMKGGD